MFIKCKKQRIKIMYPILMAVTVIGMAGARYAGAF